MKRKNIVTKLISEGFSEKTLAGMTDKQLGIMISRVLPEQYVQPPVNVSKTDVNTITQLKQQKKPFATYEGEVKEMEGPKLGTEPKDTEGKEATIKKLKFKIEHEKDKGKVEDAKKLLAKLTGNPKKHNTDLNERHGGKSPTGSKTRTPKTDAGGKPKNDEKKEKTFADQRWNAPRRKGKMNEVQKLVDKIVESNIYPFTSKNEIMELIQSKMNEQVETMNPMPKTKPTIGHNGIPEFMTYDEIVNAGAAEPATAPPVTKPGTKPGTRPGTTPTKRPNPYQPGPGINPAPKATVKEHKTSKK